MISLSKREYRRLCRRFARRRQPSYWPVIIVLSVLLGFLLALIGWLAMIGYLL